MEGIQLFSGGGGGGVRGVSKAASVRRENMGERGWASGLKRVNGQTAV